MAKHELKTWPEYFEAILDGRKTFELRRDDRGYAVGDALRLREWDPGTKDYTGRWVDVTVTYKVTDAPHFGLMEGFCILGFDGLDAAFDMSEAC